FRDRNVQIHKNMICRADDAIKAFESQSIKIDENSIKAASISAIRCHANTNLTVDDNIIQSTKRDGILSLRGSTVQIIRNDLANIGLRAIGSYFDNGAVIGDNRVNSSQSLGIVAKFDNSAPQIERNILKDCGLKGALAVIEVGHPG